MDGFDRVGRLRGAPVSVRPPYGRSQDKLTTGEGERSNQKVKRGHFGPLLDFWLPGTESCKNFSATLYVKGKQTVDAELANTNGESALLTRFA